MAYELAKAIYSHAVSDATLAPEISDNDADIKYKIFLEDAPEDADFPYIVYYLISVVDMPTFNSSTDVINNLVQFSIFENTLSSATNISSLRDKVVSAFNRASLTYDTKTAVGCLKEAESGPIRIEDGWMWSVDFRIYNT